MKPKIVWFFLLLVSALLIISGRNHSVGTDTENYVRNFQEIRDCNCITPTFEYGFQVLVYSISVLTNSEFAYLFIISLLSFYYVYKIHKSSYIGQYQIASLSIFIISPFFIAVLINGVRQGLAAVILFYSLLIIKRRLYSSVILLLISASVHASVVMIVPFIFILYTPLLVAFLIFLFTSIFYAVGGTKLIVKYVSEWLGIGLYEKVSNLYSYANYDAGIRIDFLLLLVFVGILGAALSLYKDKTSEIFIDYKHLLKIYYVLTMPFLWLGWANYSNRYALYAFTFIPLILSQSLFYFNIHRHFMVKKIIFPLSLIFMTYLSLKDIAF